MDVGRDAKEGEFSRPLGVQGQVGATVGKMKGTWVKGGRKGEGHRTGRHAQRTNGVVFRSVSSCQDQGGGGSGSREQLAALPNHHHSLTPGSPIGKRFALGVED